MRSGIGYTVVLLALSAAALSGGGGQERSGEAGKVDPRVGLKPGFRDAGTASWNMELVTTLPKPPGFFDPEAPSGLETKPEKDPETEKESKEAKKEPPAPAGPDALDFANSDLAFRGEHLFIGNFHGFNTYDVEDPRRVRLIASVVCPGGQGDVSVHGNLLVMSVEQTRGRLDCGTQGVTGSASAERFRGVRIFDISDVARPRQVAAVQTCRGSHTHTLVRSPQDTRNLYIYGSGTSTVRSAEELAECVGKEPKDDPNTSLFSIDVIQVPLDAPEKARIVNRPRIFADAATGAVSGLWPGGDHGPGTQKTSATDQCHDITVFPDAGLAAGACSGNGLLLDISDPVHPVRLDAVSDHNFAYWHSATFNNDGTKVVFTDEWGGGTAPRCRAKDPANWGANAIFDIVDRKLRFGSYYKLPAPQTEIENCVAHNGSTIPVPGRDIMVQAWYQGGISVFDFTDSANPVEIAFFDRGPVDPKRLITAGHWSAYWYNGYIYASEIARGLDVLRLGPSEHLSRNELEAAVLVREEGFNAQEQRRVTWPASPVVARAYLDQLARSGGITPERAAGIRAAIDRAARVRSPRDAGAGALAGSLSELSRALENDAASAAGSDGARLRALARTLQGIGDSLR